MPDFEISNLPAMSGTALQGIDPIPLTDLSASETKKITAKDLIQNGIALIDAGSIPGDKFNYTPPPGSIGTLELADGSVTAIKMADGSSGIVQAGPLPTGNFQGQIGVDLTTDLFYVWDGGAWHAVAAAGSVNEVTSSTSGLVLIAVSQTGDTVNLEAGLADTTAASQFLAGPDSGPGLVTQRNITSADLPLATTTETGTVVPGSGLTVNGAGVLSIDNVVTPETNRSLATWNAQGLVTGGSPIQPNDLPIASAGSVGVIYPGPNLAVDPSGELTIDNAVTPGTFPKITFNSVGLVTGGMPLEADDIPEINADSIIGEIGQDQLADCSVTGPKICDYATCLMQEVNPGQGDFLGQLWYTPSTAQLRVYSRGSGPENIWLPVGFGALQANNLRWGGTYDADADKLGVLTAIAVSEGLTAGQAFPAPTDSLSGMYFICQVEGSNMAQPDLNGITHTAGDWALCLDQAQGWLHIDANGGGGGGGGGAQFLNDLLDVTISGSGGPFSTAPRMALADKQLLKYDGGEGQWKNTDLIDGGSF